MSADSISIIHMDQTDSIPPVVVPDHWNDIASLIRRHPSDVAAALKAADLLRLRMQVANEPGWVMVPESAIRDLEDRLSALQNAMINLDTDHLTVPFDN